MPSPGMRFGRYELLERLGAGGMGEVFRARDHELRRDVAIKFLPERFTADPDRLARFTREARAASSLNHPNIITIHEIGQASGLPYMVIEFVDGQTLRRLLDRPLQPKRALDLAVQLGDGLAKAHEAGIVHRDLKPENVMVTRDGVVKILDFGLARTGADVAADGVAQDLIETQLTPKTALGAVLGTVGYMAPEQARGEPADHRSDQFALGAVLYEMATGRRAFHRPSPTQTLSDIIDHEPEPIAALNPSFPPPARWLIERCLAKEPAERYTSTQDLARDLHSVRDHLHEASTAGAVDAATPGRRPRRRWAMVALAVLVAIIAALGVPGTRMCGSPARAMRVVVLPVQAGIGAGPEAEGLLEYVVVRLAELNRFDRRVSVVPTSEVNDAGVKNPSAARKRLGATHTVGVALRRAGSDLVVSVELADAREVRTLAGEKETFRASDFSADQVVALVVKSLPIELSERDKALWNRGMPAVRAAANLFQQALTPYQQGRAALEGTQEEQDLTRAIGLFNQAIELDPRYAAAYARLGEAHLRLYRNNHSPEDFAQAEKLLQKALELDDTRPSVWISLGMAYTEKGQVSEAADALRKAIASNPDGADAYRELGYAYQRACDDKQAEFFYRKALQIQDDSVPNHSYYGAWLHGVGRYDEAIAEFRRGLQLAPENVKLLSNLGGMYMLRREWDQAVDPLERAMRAGYGPAASNLAYIQFVRGRYNEAAEAYEQAATQSPREADIWRNLGSARFWATGDRSAAANAYERAKTLLEQELKIDPTNPHTLIRLAECYMMLGQSNTARKILAEGLRYKPTTDDLVTAAEVYEEGGDRAGALAQVHAMLDAGGDPQKVEVERTMKSMRDDPRYAELVRTHAKGRNPGVR
jgi:eukaryotic-like serine/threonine-protein kinase